MVGCLSQIENECDAISYGYTSIWEMNHFKWIISNDAKCKWEITKDDAKIAYGTLPRL